MKAELIPINGDPPIPITRDVTVVGRREFCDTWIDHPSLSKRHCVLVRTDGLLMLRDLATTNGTKVNGQRVVWAALLPNDRLTLGQYKVKVYLGPDDAPSPSERVAAAGGLDLATESLDEVEAKEEAAANLKGFATPGPDSDDRPPGGGDEIRLGDGQAFRLADLGSARDSDPLIELD